ncbi:subtilisin-like protease SBT4.14 [Senna tora]|uniref:Subtilisin-like protease SBT4.14 n=1 Tax=Senna tora TaxID=362788 RepID=A0A835CKG4_9FABA|nr:subtilisin-like protease SBT4.14 [Senna tora]
MQGIGVSIFNPKQKQYPLINGVDAAQDSSTKEEARFCYQSSLDPKKVKGKLVFCRLGTYGTEAIVKGIGGIGTILDNDQYPDLAQIFMAPSTIVNSTIAKPMSKRVNKEAEFAYGAGQVHPTRSLNPGLIYDMDDFSYIQFLCHEGYNGSKLSVFVGSSINCSSLLPSIDGHDAINYPTIQLALKSNKATTLAVFRRRVTNVGPGPTVYNATIRAPNGVEIVVNPTSLNFTRTLQRRSFKVVVKAKSMASMTMVSGSVLWRNGRYVVRTPVVIYSP